VFILITIIIFLFFREFIPSIIIMACAAFDVCATLAAMALFQIPLSLATIPAILMLVGYSVDTDILLTTRVLKRKDKDDRGRAMDAFNTGVTMTGTTLAAVTTMLIVSYFAQMVTVFELAAVLFFGLIADLAGTWLMNASILLWYVERRKKVR
jgi:preprotein translocase subunit SecF